MRTFSRIAVGGGYSVFMMELTVSKRVKTSDG